jgi:hypothetical protein
MEKRGFTGKLTNDFPEHGVLEILRDGVWYRVIAAEFRSFDGPRRYSIASNTKHYALLTENDEQMISTDYHGPVYLYRTNKVVPYNGTCKVIFK